VAGPAAFFVAAGFFAADVFVAEVATSASAGFAVVAAFLVAADFRDVDAFFVGASAWVSDDCLVRRAAALLDVFLVALPDVFRVSSAGDVVMTHALPRVTSHEGAPWCPSSGPTTAARFRPRHP